jgi:hypothetical protein
MGHGRWVPTCAADRSPGPPGRSRLADLQQVAVVIAGEPHPAVIDGRGEAGHALVATSGGEGAGHSLSHSTWCYSALQERTGWTTHPT